MVPNGWSLVKLGDVLTLGSGDTKPTDLQKEFSDDSPYPVYGGNNIMGYSSQKNSSDSVILIGRVGEYCGVTRYIDKACWITDNALYTKSVSSDIDKEYLVSKLKKFDLSRLRNKGGQPLVSQKPIYAVKLPIPPLPEQRKIAKILSTWDKAISTTEKLIETSKQQKKSLMQQLLTGKKRLVNSETGKAFEGEWKFSQFNELYKVANNKATQVKSGEYLESGRTPIVDQGKSIVGGYTNNEITYKDLPVIIFGDHTRIVKWVDFEFAQGADGTQVLKSHKSMDEKFAYYALLNTDIPNLGYSRHMRELKERDFKYPTSKLEQQKIASVLTAADKEIEVLEAKLANFKQEKKALMQQLLTGKRRVKLDEDVAA
ncbi:restriction endonuclease subunit S [Neiella marina]|uniref:Restriction endonuclease subunit S n=1 Tax=Neiella holothuriorum TaxID=2870530 RepID=A0ABS7EJD8_9GAMM|nr:restriction endonuclease subunit S [Neiella holothuriorum]MBW8191993.1 restriction endonuclease subunit S [Neiella holothuriorum]